MRSGRGLRRSTGLSRNTQRQSPSITASPAEHLHDLVDPLALLVLVPALDRVLHAVPDVIAEDFLFCLAEGGPDGGDQRHDVDAVSVLVDHRWEPEGGK
jgi:hypothetical protein